MAALYSLTAMQHVNVHLLLVPARHLKFEMDGTVPPVAAGSSPASATVYLIE